METNQGRHNLILDMDNGSCACSAPPDTPLLSIFPKTVYATGTVGAVWSYREVVDMDSSSYGHCCFQHGTSGTKDSGS